jgi:2-polyprenyl-3-methyl-5-hydroxy-6-metoxy-1,4-benzoquinol methylase
MKRSVTPELLDTDSGSPSEIAGSLADLRRINRYFGSATTLAHLLRRVAEKSHSSRLSLLDVGAASGDLAKSVAGRLQSQGINIAVTLLDRAASHFSLANSDGGFPHVAADALALPFRDSTFDVVACSTFAHHLDPAELLRFANEGLRVARLAVIINDLRRHPLHLALVYAGFPLFRSSITRHDGPASVRRAYTVDELRLLLQQSQARSIEISKSYLFRMGAIAWK